MICLHSITCTDLSAKYCLKISPFGCCLSPLYFSRSEHRPNASLDYHWAEVAIAFLRQYPKRSANVASLLFEHFGDHETPLNAYSSEVHKVLDVALEIDADAIWQLCENILDDSDSSRSFYVGKWLSGSLATQQTDGAIKKISLERIWKWVDAKPAERARLFASLLPHDLLCDDGDRSLMRAFLVRIRQKAHCAFGIDGELPLGGMGRSCELALFREERTTIIIQSRRK